MLPRLIALFPGIDIGVLSNALERGQGDFEQAVSIVREGINEEPAPRPMRKARPASSAGRRRVTVMDEEYQQEDDELLQQLNQEEQDSLMANRYVRG